MLIPTQNCGDNDVIIWSAECFVEHSIWNIYDPIGKQDLGLYEQTCRQPLPYSNALCSSSLETEI